MKVLKTVRNEVLKGCKIVFAPGFSRSIHHHLWRTAKQLGATCSVEVDSSVTHVVSVDAVTKKPWWAVREKKFLVNRRWIEASNYLWRRQPEESFPVKNK